MSQGIYDTESAAITLDFINWPAVAGIEDQELRLFFMTLSHPEVVRRLHRAFPELFYDLPREFCFSLSQVKEEEVTVQCEAFPDESRSSSEEIAEESWADGCERLGIPTVRLYRPRKVGHREITDAGAVFHLMPLELQIQLQVFDVNHDHIAGMHVMLQGVRMVVVDRDTTEDCVWLARADHIDLSK